MITMLQEPIESGTLQMVVIGKMFQVPSLDPASFHSIFQMAIYFILLGKLLSVSLSPLLSLPATV